MKILFLVKFFHPFDRGGSEWSTHDLARALTRKGHEITVVTPNYGAKNNEVIEGIKIIRMPFPKKLSNKQSSIAPYWTNNLIWYTTSTIYCLYIILKGKYQVIHIQNNEFLPAGIIAGYITKKPSIATFRDYQSLCNLGFCLWKSNKVCNLGRYLKHDFQFFYQNYVAEKSLLKYTTLLLAALRGFFTQKILYFFEKKLTARIAVSQKVAEIFSANGIKNLKVIHNVVLINSKPKSNKEGEIIYTGKLSKGKGIDLLFKTLPGVLEKLKGVNVSIIGSGHLEKFLKKYVQEKGIENLVKFEGHMPHALVLEKIINASLVVVPSVWPEPLPRSIIETVLSGTPIVATDVGGNKEIIKNNFYGNLVRPQVEDIKRGIINTYKNKNIYKKNIMGDLDHLKKYFSEETVASYETVYSNLINNK